MHDESREINLHALLDALVHALELEGAGMDLGILDPNEVGSVLRHGWVGQGLLRKDQRNPTGTVDCADGEGVKG